ncbi:MAG: photosynthetic reaction center cytochrome c subunit [Chloroflexi bacterium]|nr:photosynthetic reaction center cytochrome c subunit [Chloroflexota bacterium]
MRNPIASILGGNRVAFLLVFLGVTGVLVFVSWWVIAFVNDQVAENQPMTAAELELSPIYVNFTTDIDAYVDAESYLAMAAYQQEFQQPQNVQVLVGLTTQEINGYMLNHVVGGLRVNCTYCHSLANFAAEEWVNPETGELATVEMENRANARRHLQLVQDLNRNWLANLDELTDAKHPSGVQMSCATCHYGQPNPQSWPDRQPTLPNDFRLPLDQSLTAENVDYLNVNARSDISLDRVQYQQNVMYHMNTALNVGCTHCHNSRYFPSREVPAIHYAQNMLQMTQYIWQEYGESINGVELGDQSPSCTLCHAGNVIPPGAVRSADLLPAALVALNLDE